MKNVIFTICSKNYLAQALTLRESVLKCNAIDFFIFLADDRLGYEIPDVVDLDDSWIPNWKSMAFKYDVVEFNTSIKPFCINKLFNEGYEKVVYLDPDIYVVQPLDEIFKSLDTYSIVLTPHRCELLLDYEGLIAEEACLCVGVYNLGFIALKNSEVGNKVVKWWCKRLKDKCFDDKSESLFVDQKWMDFIPCFYPNDVLISHHLGLNVALWNWQERLVYKENGKYVVRSKSNPEKVFPLVFFHFSGYSPAIPNQLDKRRVSINTESYPEIKDLVDLYCESENKNRYSFYHKLQYAFNVYNNGEIILPIQRRMYRELLPMIGENVDPFDSDGLVYQKFDKIGILSHEKQCSQVTENSSADLKNKEKRLKKALKLFLRMMGVKKYELMIMVFRRIENYKYHSFLLENQ